MPRRFRLRLSALRGMVRRMDLWDLMSDSDRSTLIAWAERMEREDIARMEADMIREPVK